MTEYEKKNLQAKEKLIHIEGGSLHFKPNEQRKLADTEDIMVVFARGEGLQSE